jgi:hypothetical protein
MKSATKIVVSTLGTLAGLAGIEHGIGEVLHGNVATGGMAIIAWPGPGPFDVLSGEPAMTIIPNFLATGILAILVSLVYIACATVLVERKRSSLALILLSVVMLVVGAGFGSALLGIIVGLIATRINVNRVGRHTRLPAGELWPRAYVACVAAWLLLLPGSVILAYVFGTDNVSLAVPVFILAAFGTLLLAVCAAFAYDGRQAGCPNRNDCIGEAWNTAII